MTLRSLSLLIVTAVIFLSAEAYASAPIKNPTDIITPGREIILHSETGLEGFIPVRSSEGMLFCLSLNDGRVVWKRSLKGSEKFVLHGDGLYITDWSGSIKLYQMESARLNGGEPAVSTKAPVNLDVQPVAGENFIYLTGWDNRIYGLDTTTNQIVWKSEKLKGNIRHKPVVSNALLIVQTSKDFIYALDGTTGSIAWFRELDDAPAEPVTADEQFAYFAAADGILHILDIDDGSEVKTFSLNQPPVLPLFPDDNKIYAFQSSLTMYAWDIDAGEKAWKTYLSSALCADLCFTGKGMAAATEDLILIDPESGRTIARYAQYSSEKISEELEKLRWNRTRLLTDEDRKIVVNRWPMFESSCKDLIHYKKEDSEFLIRISESGAVFALSLISKDNKPSFDLCWVFKPEPRLSSSPVISESEGTRRLITALKDERLSITALDNDRAGAHKTHYFRTKGSLTSPLLAHQGAIYAGGSGNIFYRFSVSPPAVTGFIRLNSPSSSSPAAWRDKVYFKTDGPEGRLYAWSPSTAESSIKVADGIKFNPLIDEASGLLCLVSKSGEALWMNLSSKQSFPLQEETPPWTGRFKPDDAEFVSHLAVFNPLPINSENGASESRHTDALLVGITDAGMINVVSEYGRLLWSVPLPQTIRDESLNNVDWIGEPWTDETLVYFTRSDGLLIKLHMNEKRVAGVIDMKQPVTVPPTVYNEGIIFGSGAEIVYFSMTNLRTEWRYPTAGTALTPYPVDDGVYAASEDGTICFFTMEKVQ